jgi:ABC-type nickel/cobalt efflux system permease component RcnA
MIEAVPALTAIPVTGVIAYGFLLGLKHATEADHLAAVSTIVTERRKLFSSAVVGALWGVGHTIALVAAGVFVLLLDFQISDRTAQLLEACVGIMLTVLGLNVLRKLYRGGYLHFHVHDHDGHLHAHPHIHTDQDSSARGSHHGSAFNGRALLVGILHGLAGSSALMLLVIPTIGSRAAGMLYIAVFGLGSIGGMMLMSFLVSVPFHLTAARFNRFNQLLQAASGIVSIFLGVWISVDNL